MTVEIRVEEDGEKVIGYLRRKYPHIPRGLLEKGIRKGWVRVGGRRVRSARELLAGETVKVPYFFREKKPRDIYQSDVSDWDELREMEIRRSVSYVYFAKPSGLAVQGGSGVGKNLDGMLRGYLGVSEEHRLVHRLDSSTSGIVVIARNLKSARLASECFTKGRVDKLYVALVRGKVGRRGEIKEEIGGKFAQTFYKRVWSNDIFSLLALVPITGRKHQLRIHVMSICDGIVGDRRYGRGDDTWRKKERMMLHSFMIRLGDEAMVEARVPEDFLVVLRGVGFQGEFVSGYKIWKDMRIDEKVL